MHDMIEVKLVACGEGYARIAVKEIGSNFEAAWPEMVLVPGEHVTIGPSDSLEFHHKLGPHPAIHKAERHPA